MSDLNTFLTWQEESPSTRWVDIKIKPNTGLVIWVYDTELIAGQFVSSVDEIDLKGKKREMELKELERLRLKYKGTEG